MFVLGTAGHVDHGKSVLVHALTGIDPDRLPEERERGMTIDLGFAWLKLPSGRELGIVDVPGHERFVKNMLAGVGGIDLVLLIVAADEGVMPQTREHLAIVDLLGIENGIVVITKKDLVDEEWLELVDLEVQELIKQTTLAQAPLVAVSAVTGDGLPDLISAIDHLLDSTPPKKDIGRPRLPIDRVFTIVGSGTVVTGTLIDGQLSLGQQVEVLPSGLRSRIRGLQTHRHKIDVAHPGSRVGANLANVATSQLQRGDLITNPGWLTLTKVLDAKLRLLPDLSHALRHSSTVTVYSGTSETISKIRLLDKEMLKPGESGWAQLALASPIAAVKGDRFVIRSGKETLGGGEIVDPHARRHRRFHSTTIESLVAREKGSPQEVLLAALEAKQPTELGALLAQCYFSSSEAEATVQALSSEKKVVILGEKGPRSLLFSAYGWETLKGKAAAMVQDYHSRFSLRRGMPREELRSRLKFTPHHFDVILRQLLREGALIEDGAAVRLASHQTQLTAEQQATIDAFLTSLARSPYSPPTELILDTELLNLLIQQRRVVKVSDHVVFITSAYEEMVAGITSHLKEHGRITVAEVRDLFNTSRKYALALVEYLDSQGLTRRIGDERVLR